jgi:hypothetical protein
MFGGSSPEIDVRRLIGISPEIDGRRLMAARRPARGLAHRFLYRVNRNGEIGVWTTTPHKSTGGEGACEREGPPLRPFFPHQFYENG